jgi:hypothetical protein
MAAGVRVEGNVYYRLSAPWSFCRLSQRLRIQGRKLLVKQLNKWPHEEGRGLELCRCSPRPVNYVSVLIGLGAVSG